MTNGFCNRNMIINGDGIYLGAGKIDDPDSGTHPEICKSHVY